MGSYREPARLLRLMAHPMRLEILTIVRGRTSASAICRLPSRNPSPMCPSNWRSCAKKSLIIDHKEGTNVFYGLAGGPIGEQLAAVLGRHRSKQLRRGHQVVAGCYCPKCEPGGTCSLPVAAG